MLHRSRTAWLEDAAAIHGGTSERLVQRFHGSPALYSTRLAQANAGPGGLRLTGC
jgi:hypothetical protein